MKINNLEPNISQNVIKLILDASQADTDKLRLLRKEFIKNLDKIGAKNFVTTMADILKNNFCIEGCNDVRIPLKRIFNISLDELEKTLLGHSYNLPQEHPISILSDDHKENIKKLKMLRFFLGRLNLNKETPIEEVKNKVIRVKDYYTELDSHIRKEEEALFPILEASGMKEHPENLREEHKNFSETLSTIIGILKAASLKNLVLDLDIEEISRLKEKFISEISNHIFREAYIFYPAALEFIVDKNQWERIEKEFKDIEQNITIAS